MLDFNNSYNSMRSIKLSGDNRKTNFTVMTEMPNGKDHCKGCQRTLIHIHTSQLSDDPPTHCHKIRRHQLWPSRLLSITSSNMEVKVWEKEHTICDHLMTLSDRGEMHLSQPQCSREDWQGSIQGQLPKHRSCSLRSRSELRLAKVKFRDKGPT